MRAHRQRLPQRLGGVRGGHRQQGDLAVSPGRLDELERGLEDVLVVAVDDGRDRGTVEATVRPEALAGRRGIRDGLDEYDDAHEVDVLRVSAQSSRPSNDRATTSRWICCVPS